MLASVAPVVPAAGGSTRAGRSECESEPHPLTVNAGVGAAQPGVGAKLASPSLVQGVRKRQASRLSLELPGRGPDDVMEHGVISWGIGRTSCVPVRSTVLHS